MKPNGTRAGIRRATILVGFAVSGLFLLLAGWRLDRDAVATAFTSARWWPFVPLAIGCYVCGHVIRGLRCRLLVREQAHLSRLTASNIVVVGYAVNNLLPARLGEFARAGMLAERTGMSFTQSLTITFLERVLDGLVMVGLLVLAPCFVPVHGWILQSVTVAAPVFGIALVAVIVCAVAPYQVVSATSRMTARLWPAMHDRAVGIASQITQGLSPLRNVRNLASIVLLSVMVWLIEGGLFLFIMPCFGIQASYPEAIVVMTATNLGILVPSSPGFIGPFHYFAMRSIGTFGVGDTVAFSYAAVVHLAFYAPVTLWGVVAMVWYGVELGTVLALQRAGRPLEAERSPKLPLRVITSLVRPAREPRASRLIEAICGALLPVERVQPTRQAIERVSSFVAGQLQALPWFLRLALHVGLTGFSASVWMTDLRGFVSLPIEVQRRIVAWWAWGPFGLTRQLFRPLRSTVLLAWYEDSEMIGALGSEESAESNKSECERVLPAEASGE